MRRWLVLLLIAVCGEAAAIIVAPTTMYYAPNFSSTQKFASILATVDAVAAGSRGSNCSSDPYAADGFAKYVIESTQASPSGFYGNCPKADGTGYWIPLHTWTSVYVVQTTGCSPPTYAKGNICTDGANTSGGAAPAGTSTENLAIPYNDYPNSPPGKVCVNGLGYTPTFGNNQCALGGVQQWCVTATNDGTTCTAGSGGYVGAQVTSNGIPYSADTTCSGNQIVNTTTGVATCMGASATQPIKTVSTTADTTSGNMVKTVTVNTGSGAPGTGGSTTITTPSGSVTVVPGAASPVPTGGGGGGSTTVSNFPSDYAKTGEAAAAAATTNAKLDTANSKLDTLHSDLTSTSGTAPGDPTVRPASDISGLMPDSTFAGLTGWSMPARSVSCPTASFTLWGHSYMIDAHCTLWSSVGSSVSAVMLLAWGIGALLIVLGA